MSGEKEITMYMNTHRTWRSVVLGAGLALLAVVAIPHLATAAPPQRSSAQKPALDITFTSKPSPPKSGENTFEVTVKDPSGKPVTDADVSAMFYMAPMGAMPEMKNATTLTHQKDGRYVGTGHVVMAGKWDVTVSVKRAGKEIGSKKFPITAK
jgi:hypothetical protein